MNDYLAGSKMKYFLKNPVFMEEVKV